MSNNLFDFKGSALDFKVDKVPMHFNHNGHSTVSKDMSALVRADNSVELGFCGNRYVPIQNETVFNFVQSLFSVSTEIEKAYSFDGGTKNVLFSQVIPEFSHKIGNSGDEIQKRVFALFHHRVGFAIRFGLTERVASCKNVFPSLLKETNFRVTHDQLFENKLELGKDLFNSLKTENNIMNQVYDIFASTPLVGEKKKSMSEGIVKHILWMPEKKSIESMSTRAKNKIGVLLECIESEMKSKGENLWGLFNGVTYYANHVSSERKVKDEDQRLFRLFYKSENFMMNRALSYCKRSLNKTLLPALSLSDDDMLVDEYEGNELLLN